MRLLCLRSLSKGLSISLQSKSQIPETELDSGAVNTEIALSLYFYICSLLKSHDLGPQAMIPLISGYFIRCPSRDIFQTE